MDGTVDVNNKNEEPFLKKHKNIILIITAIIVILIFVVIIVYFASTKLNGFIDGDKTSKDGYLGNQVRDDNQALKQKITEINNSE